MLDDLKKRELKAQRDKSNKKEKKTLGPIQKHFQQANVNQKKKKVERIRKCKEKEKWNPLNETELQGFKEFSNDTKNDNPEEETYFTA